MNMEILTGRCLQAIGLLREFWGRLTRNELDRMRGQQLVIIGQMRIVGGQVLELLRKYSLPGPMLSASPQRVDVSTRRTHGFRH